MSIDLQGSIFSRLQVIEFLHRNNRGDSMWLCKCICGNSKPVSMSHLKSGDVKSCGCLAKDFNFKHGLYCSDDPFKKKMYRTHGGMKTRCLNKKFKYYNNYGGRGIKICNRWLGEKGVINFISDMGYPPTLAHSIDRINNNSHYSLKNCKWSTWSEQQSNKKNNVKFKGETSAVACQRLGGSTSLINGRLKLGWSLKKAFTTSVKKRYSI